MNLYNIMVYYNGEGSTNIYLPTVGDVNITHGRPLYLKNCGYNTVEALRQFRKLMIDFKIGANSDGAFRTIDFSALETPSVVRSNVSPVQKEAVSANDISSILSSGTNGPIILEESQPTVDYSQYKLPSGSFEGKTLSEVDKEGKLKAVYNGFKTRNPEVKNAIEKYYESLLK